MKHARLAACVPLLLAAACADGVEPIAPPAASPAAAVAAAGPAEVSGDFAAQVDFSTLSLTPRGRNCLLEVDGQLVFTGTIEGTAVGRTAALVLAPCEEVAVTPPGTYPDVFRSEAEFDGTVDGAPATAHLVYMGRVQPGGAIEGRLVFSKGVQGKLDVESIVAVGGTYEGAVVLP